MITEIAEPQTSRLTVEDDETRWRMVAQRDKSARDAFLFGVKSTGIVCRPGCPARTPLRRNVQFFESLSDALREGYRPCRRCTPEANSPDDRHHAIVAEACRQLLGTETPPRLHDLARDAGMSPWHFHRLFKAVTGVTPKQYATTARTNRVRRELAEGTPVTRAIYDAGFESSGSFYSAATRDLGMTPTSYRAAGAGETITFATARSSLGAVLVAATDRGICAIAIGDSVETLEQEFHAEYRNATRVPGDARFRSTVHAVIECIDGAASEPLVLPLDVRGTAFQHRVWRALRAIPPGSTATYTEIARAIGAPRAARAVARACASNPVAVAIPCHRVIRTDGGLGGYRWGLERKRLLLEEERAGTRRH